MAAPQSSRPRVVVDGKFFRLGANKFYAKGVTYGPFAPNGRGEPFASPEQTVRDFALVRELNANLVRVYYVPPRWFLDLAEENQVKVMVDVPWSKHVCFLDTPETKAEARRAVHDAAVACAGHPAVFALSVVNEIPPDVVRWSGAKEVADFIEELVEEVKSVDPELLCTFANYPPTEYLAPQNIDFLCFNVYLHQQRPLENYVARLQMLADTKPAILGEFGLDSLREGEDHKSEVLSWQIETVFRGGLAGAIVYSFTDDWFKDGQQINDWQFGVTTRNRQPKASYAVVQKQFRIAPHFELGYYPMVSVVVASYNGGRTLKICLESLERLNYPNYEVILVDDGSTDTSPQIASLFKYIRYIRQDNMGLSVARNTGIKAAKGEIVAFTDSDCRADEDWLYYIVGDLLNSRFTGIGGHNFLPPEDSWIASAVMVSPGGPAHVMLTDRLAEHIPGCNMAFYKWALDEIGGFDPIYMKAGDDVDVCWRLQQRGYKIGFSSAGFVWHYRRSTVRAYLKQQRGYGEAEALLVRKHPEYFNSIGGSIWHGRIYTPAKIGIVTRGPMIYHGLFGSAFFQSLYQAPPSLTLLLLTSLEYHVLVTLPVLVLGSVFTYLIPLGIASIVVSLALCVAAAVQADLPKKQKRFWSRPLIALLFLLQPIVRGWARYGSRLRLTQTPLSAHETLDTLDLKNQNRNFGDAQYWASLPLDRVDFIWRILQALDKAGWQNKSDAGWNSVDVEIYGSRWCYLEVTTVAQQMGNDQQLIRCRLQPRWSLLSKVLFSAMLGFELLVLGVLGRGSNAMLPMLAILVITLIGFNVLQRTEQRNLQRIIGKFLDDVAKQMNLIRLDPKPPAPKSPAK